MGQQERTGVRAPTGPVTRDEFNKLAKVVARQASQICTLQLKVEELEKLHGSEQRVLKLGRRAPRWFGRLTIEKRPV